MPGFAQCLRLLRFAPYLSAVLILNTARAQVSVTPTVTSDATAFHYDYAVANLTASDLAVITLTVAPVPHAVLNLTAPNGFIASFDTGVGLLSFLEDADPATLQTFAPGTTVSGFRFDSVLPPVPTTFEALNLAGGFSTGPTLGPADPGAVIPEPGTLALLGTAALPFLLGRRRNAYRCRPSPRKG